MKRNLKTTVEALFNKASESNDAAQAVNFAQAALNAAKALQVLADIEKER